MNYSYIAKKLVKLVGENNLRENEPMSKHTTFRVGGDAKILVYPNNTEELSSTISIARECSCKYFIIGNGSNIIVKDKGYDGIIIKTSLLNEISMKDNVITAGGGTLLPHLSKFALEHSLSGVEFLSGIPGTLGGAVVMNAGAYGTEIKDILLSAVVLNDKGEIVEIKSDDLKFSYRRSMLQNSSMVVVSAVIELESGDRASIQSKMTEMKRKRSACQPLSFPNGGSIFKRIDGMSAGEIIEKAGLKNLTFGGAKVSEKHANFIVNTGNAKAADIIGLIGKVKEAVMLSENIELETEIIIIGE